jgi:hypothetical protein
VNSEKLKAYVELVGIFGFGLLLPQIARASDYSGLMPLYVGFVMLVGGVTAGLEWVLINSVMDRGDEAGDGDRESQNKSRFGCGLGTVLWAVNSLGAHLVIITVWG